MLTGAIGGAEPGVVDAHAAHVAARTAASAATLIRVG
jgi:hypothetical protein